MTTLVTGPSNLHTTSFSIDTTNLALVKLVKLSADQLMKLKSVYEANLSQAVAARQFSNIITTYSLGVTLLASLAAYKVPNERAKIKRTVTIIAFAAGFTALFTGFKSLVHTFQIADYRFWRDACITIINPA